MREPAPSQAENVATAAGLVTSVAGVALMIGPKRFAGLIGMKKHPEVMRLIGISDLVVAPGLLMARPRWPWLFARAALNAVLVACAVRYREPLGERNSRIGAATFSLLTLLDGGAAAVLYSAGR